MKTGLALIRTALLMAVALPWVGCLNLKPTSDPTRYFVLTATEQATEAEEQGVAGPDLGIFPVALPSYARSPWIAMRTSDHEVRYAEFDRWAEPIEQGVQRVIAANLSSLLNADHLQLDVWKRDAVDLELRVGFNRFDLSTNGNVRLSAHWQITCPESGEILRSEHGQVTHDGVSDINDPSEAVAALSSALGELSREIARSIESAH